MSILQNTIINADCLKALPMLPDRSVDFILTDPPYITRYKSRDGRIVPNDDNDRWLQPASMAGRRRTSSCRRIVRRVFVSWDISHFRSDIRRVHVMYATSTNAPTCSLRAIRVTRRTLSVT
jgi:16S rRNA G966 N2-methylase RsmD